MSELVLMYTWTLFYMKNSGFIHQPESFKGRLLL